MCSIPVVKRYMQIKTIEKSSPTLMRISETLHRSHIEGWSHVRGVDRAGKAHLSRKQLADFLKC